MGQCMCRSAMKKKFLKISISVFYRSATSPSSMCWHFPAQTTWWREGECSSIIPPSLLWRRTYTAEEPTMEKGGRYVSLLRRQLDKQQLQVSFHLCGFCTTFPLLWNTLFILLCMESRWSGVIFKLTFWFLFVTLVRFTDWNSSTLDVAIEVFFTH